MPNHKESTPELRDILAKTGRRYTRQREAVFTFLYASQSHPTADQVYDGVRCDIPNISLGTVYKCLEALVDAGLAAKIADSSGPARFDCRFEPHYHMRCTRTGQVADLATPYDPNLVSKLDPALLGELEKQGFHVTGHRLELVGYFK